MILQVARRATRTATMSFGATESLAAPHPSDSRCLSCTIICLGVDGSDLLTLDVEGSDFCADQRPEALRRRCGRCDARTSDKPAGAFGSDEELRRSLAAFQANEQAQFARPVPQRQSTQIDHFMTNPGAPQGVGGAAAQSASPAAAAPVVAKRKQPASELHTT